MSEIEILSNPEILSELSQRLTVLEERQAQREIEDIRLRLEHLEAAAKFRLAQSAADRI